MEIDIKEGGHTLVIGRYHDIVELNKKLEKHKAKESFLTFDELVTLVRQYDVIFGGAHVYRQGGHIPCLLYTSPSPRDRQKSRMPSSA